jgi:hypothetical protein
MPKRENETTLYEFHGYTIQPTLIINPVRVLIGNDPRCWIEIVPTPDGITLRANDDTAASRVLTVRPDCGNMIVVTMEPVPN